MLSRNTDKKREQMQMFSMDSLVPPNHLLRAIDKAISFDFIYDLVEEKYSPDKGRPSLDPVLLIKLILIQYLYGIKSMRQTIKEIEVNVAYRWFLGLDMTDPVPHFSTFGKNYTRRFKDTDLFEQIFAKVLEQCFKWGFVDTSTTFVDATHIKASANKKKAIKRISKEEALFYEDDLKKEITRDRSNHGKKPLKDKDDDDNLPKGGSGKLKSTSTTDPESGFFHKGEHKSVFAYTAQTACDKHGWILGYTIHKGNEHDSRTFYSLYEKLKELKPETIVMDAGYKTPAIAKLLIDDGINPLLPYKRPMTKEGFFKKYEYVYDEFNDCYICPNNQVLNYRTTNRNGYKEYYSNGVECMSCPMRMQCTHSKNAIKEIRRHVWEDYMETVEDIRFTIGSKELYGKRKETIERIFGDAKENHGLRYTRQIGKAKMEMKVGLTFACMNMKKLARMLQRKGLTLPALSRELQICY